MSSKTNTLLEEITALAKRRGFVYQSADLYGGLNGVYDFGHLGVLMKENIRKAWKQSIKATESPILFLEGAILGPQAMWEASGHVQGFNDPMVDCTACNRRYRTDEIDLEKNCPHCGKKAWTEPRQFNMMFKTQVGALQDSRATTYLRPETAQSIFVNLKNILSTNRVKIPFGVAQIGKAFRNEITPKQFLFRMREFEQMELEWFCKSESADRYFTLWQTARLDFYTTIGIPKENIRVHYQTAEELAHYSIACADIEYHFPFGWKELEGIANRGSYDLDQHSSHSGKDLGYYDEEKQDSILPYVIESSVGVDRLFLTLLCAAFSKDVVEDEERIVLRLHPRIAPIKAAILPLSKKLSSHCIPLYQALIQADLEVQFDETGSIGKRYRRQDEIGTPLCITYDFQSEEDYCVTVRDRDTTRQERIKIDEVESYIRAKLL